MDFKAKKLELAQRIVARASTGLFSLECLLEGLDAANLRVVYMLLSYTLELILKSRLVLLSDATNIKILENELKNLSHDIKKISEKLGKDHLSELGIQGIRSNNRQDFIGWIIKIDNVEIPIEDFTNIRYDFMSDDLRTIQHNEMETIEKSYLPLLEKLKSQTSRLSERLQ
ncbi:MAG: hypothetical protein P4M11_13530 [Candidatus Pacebacteria bacterium]|nr:hypothetical protein [Candidatus Paceibacterota bacterium]